MSDQVVMIDTIMSDMDVMYWLPYSNAAATVEGQKEVALGYIKDFIKHWDELGYGVWAICIRDAKLGSLGSFIGYCGFLPEQIELAGPELAYAMKKSMWRKGLVTEALIACLDWIFVKLEIFCVHAVTDKENVASRRVLEKIGMSYKKDVNLPSMTQSLKEMVYFHFILSSVRLIFEKMKPNFEDSTT